MDELVWAVMDFVAKQTHKIQNFIKRKTQEYKCCSHYCVEKGFLASTAYKHHSQHVEPD